MSGMLTANVHRLAVSTGISCSISLAYVFSKIVFCC